ncbi:hypothetical protein SK128_026715 [Halocaridina rubra]|uniref:SSD domain-containing protein n=1 Tax=Halocaridina rubra TaxID=373956 RepID=A0AAN8ZWV8_HALRR
MKPCSISNLQELIKTIRVKKATKKQEKCANDNGGGGDENNERKMQNSCMNTSMEEGGSADNKNSKNRSSCLHRVSMQLVGLIEEGCSLWGGAVATHPVRVILVFLLTVLACALGLFNLHSELRPYKLWIPQDSDFTKVNEWRTKHFPNKFRRHVIMWEAKQNILTAKAIQKIWHLHQRISQISVKVGNEVITWNDICTRVPSLLSNETLSTDTKSDENTDYYDYNITYMPFSWMNEDSTNYSTSHWKNEFSTFSRRANDTDYLYDYDYEDMWGTRSPIASNLTEAEERLVNAVSEEVLQTVREDYSLIFTRSTYCKLLEERPNLCYETSLLEVWGYNDDIIMNLTDEKVLQDVNEAFMSNVYGYPTEFVKYLGGIQKDTDGKITAALATLHTWTTEIAVNKTTVVDLGTGDEVDEGGMAWEREFVREVRSLTIPGIMPHVHAAHSFGAVSAATIMGDIKWVLCGWAALIFYVMATLGRPLPAIAGLICVAASTAAAYGLCSAIGVPYGPINSVLPVLLVGLGVDDMYVIVAAWEASSGSISLRERAKKTLKHAGVAVTVTSLTDAVAFLVGATTQVPALRWFCIYAAVGVTAVYCLQGSVFVAALSADQHFRDSRKCGCCIATAKKNQFLGWVMGYYAQIAVLPVTQVLVLLSALSLLGAGIWGTISLRQEFSPIWFLPRSSYLYQWFVSMDAHFPGDGERGTVYFSNVSLPEELPTLRNLAASLKASPYVSKVDAWFSVLDVYMHEDPQYEGLNVTKEILHDILGVFLNSKSGAQYRGHFIFNGDLSCNEPAPPFSVFKVEFQYARLDSRSDQQAAMVNVRQVVSAANLTGYHAAWAHAYSQWETDSTLGPELWRNLGVVVLVVAIMSLLLLAAARAAFLVLFSVLATLIDVAALMHIWGLTVDTVSCIALVLAIGLCIDYAAHVAHAFLVVEGSKRDRTQAAIASVGPAVLHGGFSTLLAFVMLSPSDSHLFLSFFKIFTGVSIFGLFHGLVLLPVLLSLIGPEPYPAVSEHRPSVTETSEVHKDFDNSMPPSVSRIVASKFKEPLNLNCNRQLQKQDTLNYNNKQLYQQYYIEPNQMQDYQPGLQRHPAVQKIKQTCQISRTSRFRNNDIIRIYVTGNQKNTVS